MIHVLATSCSLAALVAIGAGCGQPSAPARAPRVIGPATCVPPGDGWGPRDQLGRVGDDLVLCVRGADGLRGCWTLDPVTGAAVARPTAPIPGAGFPVTGGCYQGMCSTAVAPRVPEQDAALVALHPDGRRAAMLEGGRLTVFERAGARVVTSFLLRGDQAGDQMISNAATGLWFVGETIYVRGDDAGPAAVLIRYDLSGRARSTLHGLYLGGVGVAGATLLVQEDALSTLRREDGVRTGRAQRRSVPAGPCTFAEAGDGEFLGDDPADAPCRAYLARTYRPYAGAQLVDHGEGLVGFTGSQLFVLDGTTLAETRRVEVARCGGGPGDGEP